MDVVGFRAFVLRQLRLHLGGDIGVLDGGGSPTAVVAVG
jgi:hypothetical protein